MNWNQNDDDDIIGIIEVTEEEETQLEEDEPKPQSKKMRNGWTVDDRLCQSQPAFANEVSEADIQRMAKVLHVAVPPKDGKGKNKDGKDKERLALEQKKINLDLFFQKYFLPKKCPAARKQEHQLACYDYWSLLSSFVDSVYALELKHGTKAPLTPTETHFVKDLATVFKQEIENYNSSRDKEEEEFESIKMINLQLKTSPIKWLKIWTDTKIIQNCFSCHNKKIRGCVLLFLWQEAQR